MTTCDCSDCDARRYESREDRRRVVARAKIEKGIITVELEVPIHYQNLYWWLLDNDVSDISVKNGLSCGGREFSGDDPLVALFVSKSRDARLGINAIRRSRFKDLFGKEQP